MSNKYYPPIPGKQGKRGRPSLEEMEERKRYWKATLKNNATQNISTAIPINIPEEQTSPSKNIETLIQGARSKAPGSLNKAVKDILEASPVPLDNSDKKVIKEVLSMAPEKKRGRPSKEDLINKQIVESKIEKIVVEKIQEQQAKNPGEPIVIDDGTIIDFPQFKYGDNVRKINDNLNPEEWETGVVHRHDIGSKWVFVAWRDRTKYWIAAKCLSGFQPKVFNVKKNITKDIDGGEET